MKVWALQMFCKCNKKLFILFIRKNNLLLNLSSIQDQLQRLRQVKNKILIRLIMDESASVNILSSLAGTVIAYRIVYIST